MHQKNSLLLPNRRAQTDQAEHMPQSDLSPEFKVTTGIRHSFKSAIDIIKEIYFY